MEFRNTWEFSHFSIDVEETSATVFWEHEHLEAESNEVAFYYVNSRIENNESSLLVQEVPSSQHEYYLDGLQTGEIYQFSVVGMDHDGAVVVESDWISAMPYSIAVNTELLGHWDGALDPLVGASKYNDIWGYTSPEGNEYALIGTWDGTHIVDLDSGMDNPTQVGFIPGSFSTHRDIKTHGHYMYAGTEANRQDPYLFDETGEHNIIEQGVQVVDLSDPENAILVNEWDGVIQSHNLMEGNGYLYVMGSGYDDDAWGQADLIILDLEDPAEPVKVGEWNGEYLHDICIAGDRLYGAAIYVDRIYAIDISDKSDPQTINFWDGIPSSHACWVSDDGNLLFSASETAFGHIISWDVSNLFNVNMLDEWYPEFGEEWTVHNIFYKNGYIFASHYAFGMQIIDVRDPENMVTAGFYDTFTEYPAGMFDGAWGTFPYFESNRIIISDRSTGLYVVDFSNEGWAEPFISGDVNQDDTVNVLDILMIVAHIIEYAPLSTSQWQAADVNSDEIVNVLDIITIINIILYN
jgi:choice-of-anchor B domain-containing protein